MASASEKKAVVEDELPPPYDYGGASIQTDPVRMSVDAAHIAMAPTQGELITHLKLLQAFSKLRASIEGSNCVGINDDWLEFYQPYSDTTAARALIAEKRWAVFVARATDRFEAWWKALQLEIGQTQLVIEHLVSGANGGRNPIDLRGSPPMIWTLDKLPPLDVLMVWHAFLLNPHKYLEQCLLDGMMRLWHAGFPMTLVDSALGAGNGEYAPAGAPEKFTQDTKRPWSPSEDSCYKVVKCPMCEYHGRTTRVLEILPTKFDAVVALGKQDLERGERLKSPEAHVKAINEQSNGWADDQFRFKCSSCSGTVTHDTMRAAAFIKDSMRYYRKTAFSKAFNAEHIRSLAPLPGTVIDINGGPNVVSKFRALADDDRFFSIRLIDAVVNIDSGGLRKVPPPWPFSMGGIRTALGKGLTFAGQINYAENGGLRRKKELRDGQWHSWAQPRGRLSMRKLMSRYNDNWSPFMLNLAGAVLRQGSFISKMQAIDWLHSPAISFTVPRIIQKYLRFFEIVAEDPSRMAVPTLDVDLAWHTHQLTGRRYYNFSIGIAKRFIDHDDRVSEARLSIAFQRTSNTYQRLYGEPYAECTCWYCEAIHASYKQGGLRRLFKRQDDIMYLRPQNARGDGDLSPHISTHNAVRIQNPDSGNAQLIANHLKWLKEAYSKACERARRDGRPEPIKRHCDTFSVGIVSLGDGTVETAAEDIQAGSPRCVENLAGRSGSCIAATCAGGAAFGACAIEPELAAGATCGGGCAAGCG